MHLICVSLSVHNIPCLLINELNCIIIVIILKKTPRMIEESVVLMDKLGTILLSTKVVGESEPSVFKTAVLSMVLDRQTPLMLVKKRLQLDAGSGGVTFPSLGVLLQNFQFPVHSLDAQVSTRTGLNELN